MNVMQIYSIFLYTRNKIYYNLIFMFVTKNKLYNLLYIDSIK